MQKPSLPDIDISATASGLHISNVNLIGNENNVGEVILDLEYDVHAAIAPIHTITAGVPQENVSFGVTHTTEEFATHQIAANGVFSFNAPGCPAPFCQPVMITPTDALHVTDSTVWSYNDCHMGPPETNNQPHCSVGIHGTVDSTYATVPEPGTWVLLAQGYSVFSR
ncbi:MAG: hypothetical protein ABI945_08970 [Nitrospirales bacterium]